MRRVVWSWLAVAATLVLGGSAVAAIRSSPHTTTVPHVTGKEVSAAYRQLHRAGLRVSIRHGWAYRLSEHGRVIFPEIVVRTIPRAGQRLRAGVAVRLVLQRQRRPPHSLQPRHEPRYRVPQLAGRPARIAYAWVRSKVLWFDAHLGSLHAGNASTLLGNYRAARQWPGVGAVLRDSNRDGRTTPLSLWAHQYEP